MLNKSKDTDDKKIKVDYCVSANSDDLDQKLDRAFDVLFESVINNQLINNNEEEK